VGRTAAKARLAHLEDAGADGVLESSRAGVLVRCLYKAKVLSDVPFSRDLISLDAADLCPQHCMRARVLMRSGPGQCALGCSALPSTTA